MIITPLEPLQPSTDYAVVVSTEARSQEGLALEKDYVFSFTTMAEIERQIYVIDTFPANGSLTDNPETAVMFLFSEPIKIMPGIKINPVMTFEIHLEDEARRLLIYPEETWPSDIPIEIFIDIDGEILSEPYTLTFTVE
jgi:hypothetical protein